MWLQYSEEAMHALKIPHTNRKSAAKWFKHKNTNKILHKGDSSMYIQVWV
jgi:hypothetical protein